MCIVIDTNAIASVFNRDSCHHTEYIPVLEWILKGNGKVVFGGTKYKSEIPPKYFSILNELKRAAKAVEVNTQQVDENQQIVEAIISHRDFDDAHLVAIIIVSRCKLICSEDARADIFIKDRRLYPKRFPKPKIYRNLKHVKLLCDQNIVDICKSCSQQK